MNLFSKDKNDGFMLEPDILDENKTVKKTVAPHSITAEEITAQQTLTKTVNSADAPSPLYSLRKRIQATTNQNEDLPPIENKVQTAQDTPSVTEKTLLEKLQPYTVDEEGQDLSKNELPLYRLESVAEILKTNGEKALESLSKKYDISVDDLGRGIKKEAKVEKAEVKTSSKSPNADAPTITPAFEEMVTESVAREEKQLFEDLFPKEEKDATPNDIDLPDISDIDNIAVGVSKGSVSSDTATVRFTPIKDSRGNTDHISITRVVDVNSELSSDFSAEESRTTALEKTEFEMYKPTQEITDLDSGKKIMRKFAIKKRNGFLRTVVSAVMMLAISVFTISPISDFIISNPTAAMIICGSFLCVSVLVNIFMFADFLKLFKKKCSSDVLASLAAVSTLILTVNAAITASNAYYMILLCSFIVFIRSLFVFKDVSTTLSNLRQIVNTKPKCAVKLIDDGAATFAMAKGAIDGDVLIAAPRSTDFVNDFMKYSEFGTKFSGRTSFVFYVSLALSVISAVVAYFYYDSSFSAFYCAAAISCIAAVPTLFLIDSLPLSCAAKRLNAKGAMIAGKTAAETIELANAAVVSTTDIFPAGTITMNSIKVLSDNNIDEILVRAASLTYAVNSPLSPIFKQIAGSNKSYSIPDSDTVKYEKRLGISGWVDNELLFIGNRSLMEAHGIAVPNIEVDKKILRRGFFPVYVATGSKACALLVIRYEVRRDIARELRRITELGVTLLINNCDPNVNEEMICDYFGLYADLIKIMTNAGVHMYKSATLPSESCSAPASFMGNAMSFVSIMNCASRIKKSNLILTVLYVLFAVFGAAYFIYASFSGVASLPDATTLLIYGLSTTILSLIIFLIKKP